MIWDEAEMESISYNIHFSLRRFHAETLSQQHPKLLVTFLSQLSFLHVINTKSVKVDIFRYYLKYCLQGHNRSWTIGHLRLITLQAPTGNGSTLHTHPKTFHPCALSCAYLIFSCLGLNLLLSWALSFVMSGTHSKALTYAHRLGLNSLYLLAPSFALSSTLS